MKEICKLAQEKGFKSKTVSTSVTLKYHLGEGKNLLINDTCNYLLLCEIQKWLREELDIHIEITSHKYKIKELRSLPRSFRYNNSTDSFSSYEEALIAGIKETLKTI